MIIYPVVHIVKRLGRVGGMEAYVWHLVHGLAQSGIQVFVVCEEVCESPGDDIRVFKVEASPERPRWKSMMTFRGRVKQLIENEFSGQSIIIHSHERSICHQVTTFHGPPISRTVGLSWLSKFDRRYSAWRRMEEDELLNPGVQMVLPVSSMVRDELLNRYPEVAMRKLDLAWPGVRPSSGTLPKTQRTHLDNVKFVFVGKEWKRKGLDIALAVVQEFRKLHPSATLTIFGITREDLPVGARSLQWVTVKGWSPQIPWSSFDMLLLPSRKEPFGMVVSEARAHGLPVLMSTDVGAVDLGFSSASVINVTAPTRRWSESAGQLILHSDSTPEVKWTWDDLVKKHISFIYPQIRAATF